MDELKTLLGMDLPDEAKELLNTVNTNYGKLNDANTTLITSIETKERANAEIINDRKELREQIKTLEDSKVKTDDKSIQEKIDKLNQDWTEKYQAKDTELSAIKTDILNKSKFDEFNGLNIAKLLPSDWDDNKASFAMDAIKSQVLANTVHDEQLGWVYRENDVTLHNAGTGKPMTIADKFDSIKSSGTIDMFLADTSNSGGGKTPSGQTPTNQGNDIKMSSTEMMKQGRK